MHIDENKSFMELVKRDGQILQLGPHVCEEVSSRRIQDGVPESASEASSEDHNLVLHGS